MAPVIYKWLLMVSLPVLLLSGMDSTSSNSSISAPGLHPLFISVTEMEYNAKTQALEISCKVFTDDLEKGLAKANGVSVDMYNPKDKTILEKQLSAYIMRHVQIKADGKPLSLEYVGYELEEQSTWSYYQVTKLPLVPKKIEVFSNLFYEMYDKQINIIHVSIGGNRKSTKLDFPETTTSFDF